MRGFVLRKISQFLTREICATSVVVSNIKIIINNTY